MDFNGDGTTDILWRCADASGAACTEGTVVIWEMNGGTITAGSGLGVVPIGWTIKKQAYDTSVVDTCLRGTGFACFSVN